MRRLSARRGFRHAHTFLQPPGAPAGPATVKYDASKPDRSALLERDGECSAIETSIGRISDAGSVLYVEANAGLGKSRLLATAGDLAADAGLLVLSARATELEQSFPFGLARQLLAPHVPASTTASRQVTSGLVAPALPLFDGWLPSALADPTRIAVIQGLCALVLSLTEAGERRGVLVAVDDAHWSDTASLRFLLSLAERLPEAPIVLAVTVRPGETGRRTGLLTRLADHSQAKVLRPRPLGSSSVATLIAQRCGSDPELEFVEACVKATGGNPFFLEELIEQLNRDGISPSAYEAALIGELVPEAVLRSVIVRLGRLPKSAAALVAAVAILGDRTPLRRAARLAGLAAQSAETAADALVRTGILTGEPLEFVHPLIGSAILADMPEFARRRARRRAAELLSADGAPIEHICAQLLLARGEGDAWTIAQLRAGAQAAVERGEPPGAVSLLARALEEPPPEDQRVAVLTELAQAEAAAGDPRALEHLERALSLTDDRRTRAEAFHALAKLYLPRGDLLAAVACAQRAIDTLEPGDLLREEIVATLLVAASSEASTGQEALVHMLELLEALQQGRPPRQPSLHAVLSATIAPMGAPAAEVRALTDVAFSNDPLVDPATYGMVFGLACTALVIVDELEALEDAATRAATAATRTGSPIALAIATQWKAAAYCLTGRLHDSVREGVAAREITLAGWKWISGWNAFYLARTHLELGNYELATTALEAALKTENNPWAKAIMFEARGRIALAQGRFAEALEAFVQCYEELPPASKSLPGVFAWRPYAAIAARALGDTDSAESWIAEELAAIGDRFVPRVRAVSLRAAGLVRGGEAGVALLQESVDLLATSPAALERAHSHIELGAALRRAGRRRAARDQLLAGLHLAFSFGATPLVQRAHGELAASGMRLRRIPQRGRAALTPSELRIAELAVSGASVPTIARILFLARKTVEWHLGNVYAKLDVHSREELRAAWEAEP